MKGFPRNIIDTQWDELPLSNPARVIRVTELLKEEPQTLFIYKDGGVIIDKLIADGCGIEEFRAVDYAKFFGQNFDEGTYTVNSPILYIYNVGTELASSTEFSDKVLHKLVQHNKAARNTTIIVSDYYTGTTFTTKYSMSAQLVDTKIQILK